MASATSLRNHHPASSQYDPFKRCGGGGVDGARGANAYFCGPKGVKFVDADELETWAGVEYGDTANYGDDAGGGGEGGGGGGGGGSCDRVVVSFAFVFAFAFIVGCTFAFAFAFAKAFSLA